MKKIAIASDHGGFDLKENIIAYLIKKGLEVDKINCFRFLFKIFL